MSNLRANVQAGMGSRKVPKSGMFVCDGQISSQPRPFVQCQVSLHCVKPVGSMQWSPCSRRQ